MKWFKILFTAMLFFVISMAGYASATVKIKVDMSILWGSELPDTVYMFAFQNSKTGSYYNKVTNLSIQSNYNPDLKGTNIDQDTTGALALTDSDKDGIYEGTFTYSGSGETAFHTRLFISKNDAKNVVHTPKYEEKTGPNSTNIDVTDIVDFRTVTIKSDGTVWVGWDSAGTTGMSPKVKAAGNVIETSWEKKSINKVQLGYYNSSGTLEFSDIETQIDVYQGLSRDIKIYAGYSNAETSLRQEITKYITYSITTANSAYVSISKESSGGVVTKVSVYGNKYSNGTNIPVTLIRNGVNLPGNGLKINVKNISATAAYQTLFIQPLNSVTSGTDYVVSGITSYDGKVLKGANLTSMKEGIYFTGNIFSYSNFSDQGSNVWRANSIRNTVVIPKTKESLTTVKEVTFKKYGETSGNVVTLPVSTKGFTYTKGSGSAAFTWREADDSASAKSINDKYSSVYTRQEIIVRISKIETEPESWKLDPYNVLNPVILGYGTTGPEAMKNFYNNTNKYVDFVFNAQSEETRVTYDGADISYKFNTVDRTVNIRGLAENKYKVQIYSVKYGSNFVVLTFEQESAFEISSIVSDDSSTQKGYYLITGVDASKFGTINVGVITKTPTDIELKPENIYFDTVNYLVGESRKQKSDLVFDTPIKTNDPIKVVEDTSVTIPAQPLDVILVLDGGSSMSGKMSAIKTAWRQIETELSSRGYNVKYKVVKFGEYGYEHLWTQPGWNSTIDDVYFATGSGAAVNGKKRSDVAINSALDTFSSEGRYLGVNASGEWEINTSKNGTPSTKWLVFMTDSNASNEITPDVLSTKIRMSGVIFSGIGGVKKDGLMYADDYVSPTGDRYEAFYPESMNADNEQHYYHLRLIMGYKFKFYQISSQSTQIYNQLSDSLKSISITKRWKVIYNTPRTVRDGSTRRAIFDVYSSGDYLNYQGTDTDREYIAPELSMTSDTPDQVVLAYFGAAGKTFESGMYSITDKYALGNSYRGVKTANIVSLDDAEYNFYTDVSNFTADSANIDDSGNNYGDRWNLNSTTTANAIVIKKVPGNGVASIGATTEEDIFSFGYNERIKSLKANDLGDKSTITWSEESSNPNASFSDAKYMLRIVKSADKGTKYRYNLYDKTNIINVMDFDTAATVNGEPGTVADEKMDSFLGGKGDNYIDYIFDKTVAESTTALGARVDYSVNTVNIVGLAPDNYAMQVYTIKSGFSKIDNIPYRVITYCGEVEFKIDQPQIAVKPSGANGIFTVDYIDVTKFGQITTHFSTKMPFKIAKPTSENIFLNKTEMAKTGEVVRVTEDRYLTSTPETEIVDSGLVIAESDLRKFKQPLDIVFCIDNSGSMQNEIDSVKNGLKSFSSILTQRGFDIKYKVINFGPDQGEILYQYKYTGTSSQNVTYPNGTENGIKVSTDEGSSVKYYYFRTENGYYKYIAVSSTAGTMPTGSNLFRGTYPNRSIKISSSQVYLENYTDGTRHEVWSTVNLGNTLGSYIEVSKVYTGKPDGTFPEVTMIREEDNNNWMTVFKDKWFDGTYATNKTPTDEEAGIEATDDEATKILKREKYLELSEVVYAFDGMKANGGYRGGQENGARAIHYAQEFLKNNGRSVDYKGDIIDDSSGNVQSTKWIIFLTDENMDGNTPGNGYTSDMSYTNTTGLHKLTKEVADNLLSQNIFLTGIFHIRNINYPVPVDKRGISGVYPADTGNIYYNEFGYMGDYFNLYEMGANGEETQAALLDSVNNIGIIQRWMMTYTTPFNVPDGSYRTVNFILGNLKASSTEDTRTPDDANTEMQTIDTGNSVVQARLYRAPDISVDVKIDNPVDDGTFSYSSENSNYVIVKGRARGIERNLDDEDAAPTFAVMKEVKVSIFKHGDSIPITGLENITYTFNESTDKLSDGYYQFNVKNIPKDLLENSGVEKFDIKVTATTEKGGDGQDIVKNVGLDAGAPKLVSLTMVNKTVITELKEMKLSDGTGTVFSEADAISLSTLNYIPFESTPENSYEYSFDGSKNITFDMRVNKATNDGRFVKYGDEVEVTAELIDENFDTTNINNEENVNVIRAKFEELTNNPQYIAPDSINYDTSFKIGTSAGVKITAVWKIKVEKSGDLDAIMNLKAIDSVGYSSQNKIGDISIAVVDNTKPTNPSWNTISTSRDTLGNNPIVSDMVNFANGGWITNNRYQVNCQADAAVDENGIRVFKVYYNYDHTKSDLGLADRGGSGNHDADTDDGGTKYFYVKAGDAINLVNDVIQPSTGIGIKDVDLINHYDDGKYVYKILAVDKSGNTTEITSSVATQVTYIDTIAPRINELVLKKVADRDNLNIVFYDNLVKDGDTARIEYTTTDYNVSVNGTDYLGTNYPEYSWMINGASEVPSIVMGLKGELNISGTGYPITVKIGDTNINNSGAVAPNMLIVNSAAVEFGMTTIVSAKDLAGNSVISTINPILDNIAPVKAEAYAYAYEKINTDVSYATSISQSIKNIYGQEPGNGVIHITRGGDNRNFYIKLRGSNNEALPIDAAYYTTGLGSIESSKKNIPISSDNIIFSTTYNIGDFLPIDGVNSIFVKVTDLVGNTSENSTVNGTITMDTMIGNATTVTNYQGGTAKIVSGNYEFKLNGIKIPEYAGIKSVTPIKIENGTVMKQITGVEAVNIDATPNALGSENTITATIKVNTKSIPDIVKGTRANLTVRFTDNLGNQKDFKISYLVPKEGLEIKAQQEGSEKETRTKVKVVGENEFELQKSEEGGKKK